eukprot:g183.t1
MLPLHHRQTTKRRGLDVEIGPIKIRQTKAGAGDKSRAYICSAFTAKLLVIIFAGIMVVGVFGFTAMNFEVRIAKRSAEGEVRVSRRIEKAARSKIIKVGSVLETYLLKESQERKYAEMQKEFLIETFESFYKSKLKQDGKEIDAELAESWGTFRDSVIGKMDDFLSTLEEESDDAKQMLIRVNSMLADESFYPSRAYAKKADSADANEKANGFKVISEAVVAASKLLGEKWGLNGKRLKKWARGEDGGGTSSTSFDSNSLGVDMLEHAVSRFFDRFLLLDTIKISKNEADELFEIFEEYESWIAETSQKENYDGFKKLKMDKGLKTWAKVQEVLQRDAIEGIDISNLRPMKGTVKTFFNELRGVLLVKDHRVDIEILHKLWQKKELRSSEVFQKLQELANLGEIPFEWFIGTRSASARAQKLEKRINKFLENEQLTKSKKRMSTLVRDISVYLRRAPVTEPFGWWTAAKKLAGKSHDSVEGLANLFFAKYPDAAAVKNRGRRRGPMKG